MAPAPSPSGPAEAPVHQCAFCSTALPSVHYQVAGAHSCATCAEKIRASQAEPDAHALLRARVYGLGAMLACAAAYFLLLDRDAHWMLSFVTILMGVLIARAVRLGADSLGGRRCQRMAVIFTYLASTLAFVPVVHQDLMAKDREAKAKLNATLTELGVRPSNFPSRASDHLVEAILLALALPLLTLATGIRGIVMLVFTAIALRLAWALTARDPRPVVGPLDSPTNQTSPA